jgi:hypothetical protein
MENVGGAAVVEGGGADLISGFSIQQRSADSGSLLLGSDDSVSRA